MRRYRRRRHRWRFVSLPSFSRRIINIKAVVHCSTDEKQFTPSIRRGFRIFVIRAANFLFAISYRVKCNMKIKINERRINVKWNIIITHTHTQKKKWKKRNIYAMKVKPNNRKRIVRFNVKIVYIVRSAVKIKKFCTIDRNLLYKNFFELKYKVL